MLRLSILFLVFLAAACSSADDPAADVCDPNPCTQPNQSLCTQVGDTFSCACDSGYHLEAEQCVLDQGDPCEPNPCELPNRTICVQAGDSFSCDCDAGYHLEAEQCVADEDNPCEPNPCTDAAGHRTRCMWDGQGGYECWCDVDFHDDQGLCCQAYAENVAGLCECVSNWVDPDDSGVCIAACTEMTVEGLNGWCPAIEVCVQGVCVTDACADVTCPEFATCVVRNGTGVCQCENPYHMSDGICCQEHASNVNGVCDCDPGYHPLADGSCEIDQAGSCANDPCIDFGLHQHRCVLDDSIEGYHCACDIGYLPNVDGACELDVWENCPDTLQCLESYCVPLDLSNEQCLTDEDCHEFDPTAPTVCNGGAAGGICLGCAENLDCPGNSQCNNYGTCANLCDDDNDCPYGRCYQGVGLCGQKFCYSDQDCFGGSVCIDEDGSGSGMCKRIPCAG